MFDARMEALAKKYPKIAGKARKVRDLDCGCARRRAKVKEFIGGGK